MRAVSISSLRSKMKYYFDLVTQSSEIIVIPRKGNDDEGIVLLSLREYNSMNETTHLLSTPANRRRLEESIQQLERGDTISYSLED